MIKAHEARELAANSEKAYSRVLEDIDKKIRDSASLGERSLSYLGERCHWNNSLDRDKNEPFMKIIKMRLEKYGFSCIIQHSANYVIIDEEHSHVELYITW